MKTLKNFLATLFVAASIANCADAQMIVSVSTQFSNQPASVSVAYSEDNFNKVYFEVNATSCDVDAMNNSFMVFAASEKDDACSFSASAVKAVLNEDTNTITAHLDHFSYYAVGEKEAQDDEDSDFILYLLIGILGALAIVIVLVFLKLK